jgi:hypothetical protein
MGASTTSATEATPSRPRDHQPVGAAISATLEGMTLIRVRMQMRSTRRYTGLVRKAGNHAVPDESRKTPHAGHHSRPAPLVGRKKSAAVTLTARHMPCGYAASHGLLVRAPTRPH